MKLDRYFAWRFMRAFGGVFAIFALILLFIGLVEHLRRYGGDDVTFAQVIGLTLLDVPKALYQILPLIMIIAAIALFLGLARSSELVVTRAAGRSALRALVAPLVMAFAIGLIAVAAFNPIVASTSRAYEMRSGVLKGEDRVLSLGETGLWLRQGSGMDQTVIRAGGTNLNGTRLSDVTFMTFEGDGGPSRRIEAQFAVLVPGEWQLTNAKIWTLGQGRTPEKDAREERLFDVPSTLTADQIRDSFGTPSSIPIWDLPAFIERLQAAGFSAQRHQVWFQMELTQPIFMMAMVLIGAAFTMRHQRGGYTGLMVLLSILLAFSVYFLRNFAGILGENGQLPAALAAWAPPLAAIGLSMGLLLHKEDG